MATSGRRPASAGGNTLPGLSVVSLIPPARGLEMAHDLGDRVARTGAHEDGLACYPMMVSRKLWGHGLTPAVSIALVACSGRVFSTSDPGAETTPPSQSEGGAPSTTVSDPVHGGVSSSAAGRTQNGDSGTIQVPGSRQPLAGAGGDGGSESSDGYPAGAGGSPSEAGAGGTHPVGCASPIVETWTTPLGKSADGWALVFGDPRVDTSNHRLVISYDDIAKRTKPLAGGYFVRMTVTLSGGTVLVPYPHSNEGPFPSLRRSQDGSAIELGMTQYGSGQGWVDAGWPNTGAALTGTTEVTLVYYVKASSSAVAAKVSHGGVVMRSRWVSGFTWEQTSLAVLQLVGMNHSVVYPDDGVYVGPLSGCEGLSDAQVEASYAE